MSIFPEEGKVPGSWNMPERHMEIFVIICSGKRDDKGLHIRNHPYALHGNSNGYASAGGRACILMLGKVNMDRNLSGLSDRKRAGISKRKIP